MVRIPIDDNVIEALREGNVVRLTHANLGRSGRNGTLYLDPDPDDPHLLEPRITIDP